MIKRSEDEERKGLWQLFATTLGKQRADGNGRHVCYARDLKTSPLLRGVSILSGDFRGHQHHPPTANRPANPRSSKADPRPRVNTHAGTGCLRSSACPPLA